jgi:uncharacterized protein
MRSLALGTLAICLAAAASGCSRSPRVTFYTLEPAPRAASASSAAPLVQAPALIAPPAALASAPAPASPAPAGTSIAVGPVTLPELVDRPQLVVRVAANRVEILEYQRWAEPLRGEIPRVIAEDLGRLLGSVRVSSYQEHAGSDADCRVLLDIQRFEGVPGDSVSLEAVWSLRGKAGVTPRSGRTKVRMPAGEGYDALVAAYRRALLAVSTDLARALRTGTAGGE